MIYRVQGVRSMVQEFRVEGVLLVKVHGYGFSVWRGEGFPNGKLGFYPIPFTM